MKLIKILLVGLACAAGTLQSMQRKTADGMADKSEFEYTCLHCSTGPYKQSTGVLTHSGKHHPDELQGFVKGDKFYEKLDAKKNSSRTDGQYHCNLCEKEYPSLSSMGTHLAMKHSNPVTVESALAKNRAKAAQLQIDSKEQAESSNEYTCLHCSIESFKQSKDAFKHCADEHPKELQGYVKNGNF